MELNRNSVDIYELLHRDNGEILYSGPEGCIVQTAGKGTFLTDIVDGNALCAALDHIDLVGDDLMVVKSREALVAARDNFGFCDAEPCAQWSYLEKEPPRQIPCDIRLLSMDYAAVAGAQYHQRTDYITERIQAGQLWGLFEGDTLAGFIGLHTEGAMGMLEIFPQFRRKGYGYALEAWLIAWLLERGWTPYCHVVKGNDASTHLQEKLGLKPGDRPAIWTWREG